MKFVGPSFFNNTYAIENKPQNPLPDRVDQH